MRISDWSSDVCSSDLAGFPATQPLPGNSEVAEIVAERFSDVAGVEPDARQPINVRPKAPVPFGTRHIGRHTGLRGYDVEIEKAVNSSNNGMPIAVHLVETDDEHATRWHTLPRPRPPAALDPRLYHQSHDNPPRSANCN